MGPFNRVHGAPEHARMAIVIEARRAKAAFGTSIGGAEKLLNSA